MKHAKKMILVEAPNEEREVLTIIKDYNDILKPNTIPDLDKDLKNILNRNDIDDREKWMLYNQSLQRYLFFLNEERKKNSVHKIFQTSFNKAPSIEAKKYFHRKEAPHMRTPISNSENLRNIDIPFNSNEWNRGQFDLTTRKHASNEDENITQNKSLFQSAYDTILPSDDEDYDEENNEIFDSNDDIEMDKSTNSEVREREGIAKKRKGSLIDNYIDPKEIRLERKPIYSYVRGPPLNRWLLELKKTTNKNKIKRVLDEINRTMSKNYTKPYNRTTITNRAIVRPKHSAPYDKDGRLHKSFQPTINLDRLPRNLTAEQIKSIVAQDKTPLNNDKKAKWERYPKIKSVNYTK